MDLNLLENFIYRSFFKPVNNFIYRFFIILHILYNKPQFYIVVDMLALSSL